MIEETGASWDFYSAPAVDGEATLDAKITAVEKKALKRLATLRTLPIGSIAPANLAAEVVAHLAPRTSHLRDVFGQGAEKLMRGVADVFDGENIFRLFGLDDEQPSEQFNKHFADKFNDSHFQSLGLPHFVLKRVAFYYLKENFKSSFDTKLIQIFLKSFSLPKDSARNGHNRALQGILGNNIRYKDLLNFEWSIEAPQVESVIVPDCVAIGYDEAGKAQPYILAGTEEVNSVVLPLTKRRILVGTRIGRTKIDILDFNSDAASCSYSFFLSAIHSNKLFDLIQKIGDCTAGIINDTLSSVKEEFLASPKQSATETINEIRGDADSSTIPQSTLFDYQLSFLGCADQDRALQISEVIKPIIAALNGFLPLNRLDGITFAADYPAALQSVDRGIDIPPPQTVSEDIGTGYAMTLPVIRDDHIKCRVILASFVADALIESQHPYASLALHTLVHQLACVAVTEWFECTCPRILLRKAWDNPHDGRMFSNVYVSLEGYLASRIAAGFSDEDLATKYRTLLIKALDRAKRTIIKERLQYRLHGDLDHFLAITYPNVRLILGFAADLLGHCDGKEIEVLDDTGLLKAALDELSLSAWLPTFQADLQKCWRYRGHWNSIQDLFVLNHHFERILWQFGVFPWENEQGQTYITIPTQSDASAIRTIRLAEAVRAYSHPARQAFQRFSNVIRKAFDLAKFSINRQQRKQ